MTGLSKKIFSTKVGVRVQKINLVKVKQHEEK